MTSNRVRIGIDPGYDGVKAVVENGTHFWCPSDVLSETIQPLPEKLDSQDAKDNIMYIEGTGNRFAVGIMARDMKAGMHSVDHDDLHIENSSRFKSPNFKRLCLTAIYCSIQKAKQEDKKFQFTEDTTIEIYVAIPDGYVKDVAMDVMKIFMGQHEFSIATGDSLQQVVLNISKVSVGSQAVLSIIGYAGDDEGYIVKLDDDDFPLLGLDLGYGTAGMVSIGKGLYVTKTESNKEYAMMSANVRTAKTVEQLSGISCTHQIVESAAAAAREGSMREAEWKYRQDGEYKILNILDEQKKEISRTIDGLYKHIEDNYDPTFIRSILVNGGSGTCFYPALLEKITSSKLLPAEQVHLGECEYKNIKYSSLYVVAVGALKTLIGEGETE